MLTVSALGGRAPTLRSTEDSQAEAFRVDVARVLEPLLDRLDELQLPDDIASLDFRIRGPYVQSFIKRLRAVIKAPTSEETEE